jgi:hypothetical protein
VLGDDRLAQRHELLRVQVGDDGVDGRRLGLCRVAPHQHDRGEAACEAEHVADRQHRSVAAEAVDEGEGEVGGKSEPPAEHRLAHRRPVAQHGHQLRHDAGHADQDGEHGDGCNDFVHLREKKGGRVQR